MKVTFRVGLATKCPHGGTDTNEILVTYEGQVERIDAEAVRDQVEGFEGGTLYAEDLARELYAQLDPRPLSVTVRQVEGHGVTVEVP